MRDYDIPTDKQIADKARELILDDLSLHYSPPVLAASLGTNPHGLKRVFKKQFGITLADYSRKVRMERARELLTTTNKTLQMIAEAAGYTEVNNFQQAFKKATGCTPGQYRKRHQQ